MMGSRLEPKHGDVVVVQFLNHFGNDLSLVKNPYVANVSLYILVLQKGLFAGKRWYTLVKTILVTGVVYPIVNHQLWCPWKS